MDNAFSTPRTLRLFPEKLFYKIGEVSRITGVESYVLRYWEAEFPFLCPRKIKSGQRIYTKKDIDLILHIKKLLYEERYTIDGVRKKLGGALQHQKSDNMDPVVSVEREQGKEALLSMVTERLKEVLRLLS
jgi:DNA-binding transcriptional MerR regulator